MKQTKKHRHTHTHTTRIQHINHTHTHTHITSILYVILFLLQSQDSVSKAETEIRLAIKRKEQEGFVYVKFGTLKKKFEIRLCQSRSEKQERCDMIVRDGLVKNEEEEDQVKEFDSGAVLAFLRRRWGS